MGKHNFKELIVWQKARVLVVEVYKITRNFPEEEKYALTSQIKRSVISIPSNIAEGAGRNTEKDFSHFLDIALGSANELESQIINATDLEFISKNEVVNIYNMIVEVQKLIYSFQKKIKSETVFSKMTV